MTTDHYAQFLPAACAGFGLFLVGTVNLLLVGRRLPVRMAASLGAIGFALAGAAALGQEGGTVATARLMALGLVPCFLFASEWFVGGARALLGALQRPSVRYLLLAVGGIGFALGSVGLLEHAEWAAQESATDDLEIIAGRPRLVASERTKATTDRGSTVIVKEPVAARSGVDFDRLDDAYLKSARLDGHVIRCGGGSDQSNCHGWVFTGGRFSLSEESVELILKDNGYCVVTEPNPGDLTIYRSFGTITHTAVVRYVTAGQPVLVEGKWGNLGVFLHPVDKSTYGTDYAFYRSSRRGHLLAGVDAAPVVPTQQLGSE